MFCFTGLGEFSDDREDMALKSLVDYSQLTAADWFCDEDKEVSPS